MTIIITGGSGFIGTNLIEYFLKKNYEVINLDINPPRNQKHYKYWHKVNLADYKNISEILINKYPEYIVHLAAKADLDGKEYSDYDINIESVKNLIKFCKSNKSVKRMIFASTMLVNQTGHNSKDIYNYNANTLYGKSKIAGEKLILNNQDIPTDFCIIRPTSIWGEWFGEPYKNFFNYVLSEKYFHPGSSSSKKTFGYVGNTVYQIEKLLFAEKKRIRNKIFYIGDMPPIKISQWANEIAKIGNVNKPKTIPIYIFKFFAIFGDLFNKIGIKFPMTSYRLKNMTTDQVYNLQDTYNVCGDPPYNMKNAIENTLHWISNN